jgi:predicted membrane-bound spermidine synthase
MMAFMTTGWLYLTVFSAGLVTLAVELSASRLLGQVFGSGNIVWVNVIGLILVYLTAGYTFGGRLADRRADHATLYGVLAWASLLTILIPFIARPIVPFIAGLVGTSSLALFMGSFISVLVIFSLPIILLAFTSPFALRLLLEDASQAGTTSGRIYAISTLGSIFGAFLAVFGLIPSLGAIRTFLTLGTGLMLIALIGLLLKDRKRLIGLSWMMLLAIAGWFLAPIV